MGVKTIILKELKDKEEMDFTALIGNLKTYEMKMKTRKDHDPYKKIGVALKAELKKKSAATLSTSKDEKLTLLGKNVNMYFENERRSDQEGNARRK